MHKHLSLLLIILVALVAAGCGGPEEGALERSQHPTDEVATTEQETNIATSTTATTTTPPGRAGDPAGEGQVVEIPVTTDQLQFDVTEVSVPAGTITLRTVNESSIPHNIAVRTMDEEVLAEGEIVSDGGVSEITVDLEPGTYQFYCTPHLPVMVGELRVTES